MSIKHGSMPVLVSPTVISVQSTSKLAFRPLLKGLNELCDWLAKYNCTDVCMESTGEYWIPVFNVLEAQPLDYAFSPKIYQADERK